MLGLGKKLCKRRLHNCRFYHVVLHRYIVIELKTGKFHPKDLGQLGFYMTAVDRQVKSEFECSN